MQTDKPGEFLNRQMQIKDSAINSNTLVLMDLDDTTITSPEGQWLGHSDMFYYLLKREMAAHPEKSKTEVAEAIDPLLLEVYRRVPVILTDETLPEVIERLKSHGVTVLGFTARGRENNEVTIEQLQRADILFTDTGSSRFLAIGDKRSFRMEKGVVFVSHVNRKGETLVALLKSGNLKKPRQVMLIDDRQSHLDDMAKALSDFDPAIDFQPVLCTYLEDKRPFDAGESERQLLDFLYQWRGDDVFSQLIRKDPFTRSFITRCERIPGVNSKSCRELQAIIRA
ncbi:MAG: DUF2608 domain-containing protein [Endozoicomonas sp.]